MSAAVTPGASNFSLSLNRPFYASIVPRAVGATATYAKGGVPTFFGPVPTPTGQTAAGSVNKDVAEAGINYGVAFAPSTARLRRVTFGVLAHHAEYSAIPDVTSGPIPNREQMAFLQLSGNFEELDFLTVRRIAKFT